MLAIRSKSLSEWRIVSPASSAVAAMMRSGTDGVRCWPRSASKVRTSTARSSIAGVRYSTGIAKAGRIGRTDYWHEDEWTAWHEAHLRGKVESLTRVDRTGDPDDLVDAAEAARMLRYSGRDVIHANRRIGYFPEPDAYGRAARGRPVPLWKRSTVWAAADRREGMGGGHKPGTPGAPAKPHPYAGDERLARVLGELRSGAVPSSAELAAEWNVSQRTAERITTVHPAGTLLSCLTGVASPASWPRAGWRVRAAKRAARRCTR
jgi:hypothetical protein